MQCREAVTIGRLPQTDGGDEDERSAVRSAKMGRGGEGGWRGREGEGRGGVKEDRAGKGGEVRYLLKYDVCPCEVKRPG